MVEKRKNIDNLFRDYLTEHRVKAPANAWNRLQSALQPTSKRRLIFYTRLAAAAILLLIAFSAGYFYSEIHKPVPEKVTEANPQPLQESTDNTLQSKTDITDSKIAETDKSFSSTKTTDKNITITKKQPSEVVQNPVVAQLPNPPGTKDITPEESNQVAKQTEIATEQVATNNDSQTKSVHDDIAPQSETQGNPELMTPEILHHLLIGDEMASLITENKPDNDYTMWSVGGRIIPVYSFRTVSGEGFETPEDNVDEAYFNSTEQGITTIGGGISLSYFFSDNLSLASGLYVSRIGQANTDVVAYDDPNGFGGTYKLASSAGTVAINPHQFEMVMVEQPVDIKDSIPGDYVVNGTFIQNMDYLEVPFVLNYKVLDRKISVNVNGGLSPGILVNNRSYFEIDGEKIQTGTTENLKPMIYNSLLGMSFEYSFSKKLIFSIEPTFKYSLTPINSNSGINYRPYSMSWFTGISYKL